MHLEFDLNEQAVLIREIVAQVLAALDWPTGRIALTEAEAAKACGVNRHVLRDLRLAGRISARKLGKKIVYLRCDLIAALEGEKTN